MGIQPRLLCLKETIVKTYTKKERKAIAGAFRAAKKYLRDSDYPVFGKGDNRGICAAISDAAGNGECTFVSEDDACHVIRTRLYGYTFVTQWLRGHGYPTNDENVVQEYRHRWLDALIKEFSK